MGKRTFSILLALALVAGVFSALPAGAQTAPPIPAEPNIVDPKGDANYIHDGHDSRIPIGRNHVTPAGSINATGDVLGVWFSHDQDNIRVHVHSATSPPSGWGLNYTVYTSPGEGPKGSSTLGCLRFTTLMPGSNQGGGTWQGPPIVNLHDRCHVGGNFFSASTAGTFEVAKLEDGSGITTSTWPRSASPLLVDGSVLTKPYATAASYTTGHPQAGFVAVPIDNTDVGLDYPLTAGAPPVAAPREEPKEEPPGKSDPPGKGKKKGCKKGKGKKKGACPSEPTPPTAPSCPTYTPGDMGKDAPLTVVTDEATQEKPIAIDVPLGMATGNVGSDRTTRTKHNVQIDSTLAEAGFYARLEAPGGDDPDLYVYYASGKQAAVAGGFNPLLVGGPLPNPANNATIRSLNGQGSGGHSEFTAEQIDGLRSADCRGWTLDLVNWGGRGGTYKLKLWLGEIQNDPAPEQAAESESALDRFFGLLLSR